MEALGDRKLSFPTFYLSNRALDVWEEIKDRAVVSHRKTGWMTKTSMNGPTCRFGNVLWLFCWKIITPNLDSVWNDGFEPRTEGNAEPRASFFPLSTSTLLPLSTFWMTTFLRRSRYTACSSVSSPPVGGGAESQGACRSSTPPTLTFLSDRLVPSARSCSVLAAHAHTRKERVGVGLHNH